MKELVLFVGIPGCGKTTFWKRKVLKPHFFRLSLDDYRKAVCGQDYLGSFEPVVKMWADTTRSYLFHQGVNILVDATSLTREIRKPWLDAANSHGYEVKCVWFKTPLRSCLRNNAKRDRYVPVDVIRDMHTRLEKPLIREGFKSIMQVTYNTVINDFDVNYGKK